MGSIRGSVILFLCILQTAFAPDCNYRFDVQPASIFTCNPYPLRELSLRCSGIRFSDLPSVQIEWFASLNRNQNIPKSMSMLVEQTPGKYGISGASSIGLDPDTSRQIISFSSSFQILNLTNEDAGQYWCQFVFTNDTQLEKLERSEVLTLAEESTYLSLNDPNCSSSNAPTLRGITCVDVLPDIQVTTPTTINTTMSTTTESNGEPVTETSNSLFLALVISIPLTAVVVTALLLCIMITVCGCIIATKRKKRASSDSPEAPKTTVGRRPLPAPPMASNGVQNSLRYTKPDAMYSEAESYDVDANPAYEQAAVIQDMNPYLELVKPDENNTASDEYAVADLDTSDEPYYVYVN